MKTMTRLFATLFFSVALFNVSHATTIEAPDALVKRISREVLNKAKTDKAIHSGSREHIRALVETTFLPNIDFQRMTSIAAGRYWRKATPAQKQELTKQFRLLLIHTYSGALSQVKDQKLQFRPLRASPTDTDVIVYSRVLQSGREPVQLNYRLEKHTTQWKIYDINLLGAWLVQTYRSSFSSEIRRSGMDGLIMKLTTKNRKLATRSSKK